MENKRDDYVNACPYCGNTEFIEAMQSLYGEITAVGNPWGGRALFHLVCRKCGSVARSYVKNPEKLLKRKDRR